MTLAFSPTNGMGIPATATAERPRHRLSLRRALLLVAGLGGAAALAYFGWQYWTVWRFQQSTDDAYVQADVVDVAPQVAGYLSQVLVTDNQAVKAGQVLAVIDQRDYVAALDQAKAQVAAAQAEVTRVQTLLDLQHAAIAEAQATVQVDQANEIFASQNEQRYGTLAKDGYGSVQNAQQATSQTDSAKASVTKDEAAVAVAEKQLDVLTAEIGAAKAALAEAQAHQTQAELDLGYTTIVSPVDGTVGDRTLRVGQYVTVGTQLMAIVPADGAYIVANFKETQLTDVRRGQPVEIEVDTFPGVVFKGTVDSLAPASGQEFALLPPDNATGNFTKIVQRIPVKILLQPGSPLLDQLRPGMSVTPTIWVGAVPAKE